MLMDEHNVFGPDISYLREERVPTEDVHHIDGPPDLAVEVRSPSTWRYNVGKKMRSYERLGLPELWLVDSPAATVLVYPRTRKSRISTSNSSSRVDKRSARRCSRASLPRSTVSSRHCGHKPS
jgi:Uma2 family endonuclease